MISIESVACRSDKALRRMLMTREEHLLIGSDEADEACGSISVHADPQKIRAKT